MLPFYHASYLPLYIQLSSKEVLFRVICSLKDLFLFDRSSSHNFHHLFNRCNLTIIRIDKCGRDEISQYITWEYFCTIDYRLKNGRTCTQICENIQFELYYVQYWVTIISCSKAISMDNFLQRKIFDALAR